MEFLKKYIHNGEHPIKLSHIIVAVYTDADVEAPTTIIVKDVETEEYLRTIETVFGKLESMLEVLQEEFRIPDVGVFIHTLEFFKRTQLN